MHAQGDLEPTLTEEQREVARRYRLSVAALRLSTLEPNTQSPLSENVKAAVAFILGHN